MSRQNLGKAVKCVTKVLPNSPSKKKSVVCALAKSFGVMNTEKKVINSGLSACDKEAIQNFYQREDISLYMPRKQDHVATIRDKNGKRKEQKRVLNMILAEAHSLFVGENATMAVGKSKFAELQQAEVLLSLKMPCNFCGCIYHGNIALLLKELYRKLPENFPLYGEEFVRSCVCNTTNKKCMTSNCLLCKTKFQTTYLDEIDEKHLRGAATWYQWEKGGDGRTEKKKRKVP